MSNERNTQDGSDRADQKRRIDISRRSVLRATAIGSAGIGLATFGASTISAADDTVLILGTTVTGGENSLEADKARALGFNVEVVDAATWGSMTTADFASYRAIILGDPTCVTGTGPIAPAEANVGTWSAAVTGNVVAIGTDPVYHSSYGPGGAQGGGKLTERGIAFAAADAAKTGAYITLSCYYHNTSAATPVPVLNEFGSFTVKGVGCHNNVAITATHPALDGLTETDLSNWQCSVHEAFDSWPLTFEVLALAEGTGEEFTAPDGTKGTPYILARGVEVISDIDLAPESADLSVGDTHTLTATVEQDGAPLANTEVTFSVIDGPHAGTTGTDTTDSAGEATFSYEGTAVGTDTIDATFSDGGTTQRSNRVIATWTEPVCPAESTRLLAGQDTEIGSVSVEQSAGGKPLVVTYTTTGDWYMTETHLHVAETCDDVPQTGSGNPQVGRFAYSTDHDPAVQEYTVKIPLDTSWESSDTLCIAAHADVFQDMNDNGTFESDVDHQETAWGEGQRFTERGNWAMHFDYEVC